MGARFHLIEPAAWVVALVSVLVRPWVQAGVLGEAGCSGDRVDFDAAGLVAAVGLGDAGQDQGELFPADGWDGVAEVDRRSVRAAEADGCGDQQVGPFAAGQRADVAGDRFQVCPVADVFPRLYPRVAGCCEPAVEAADEQFDGGRGGVDAFGPCPQVPVDGRRGGLSGAGVGQLGDDARVMLGRWVIGHATPLLAGGLADGVGHCADLAQAFSGHDGFQVQLYI